ncbi:hypothetical protein ACQPXS_37735 [Streptomyces sp. CA-142005]
MKISQSITERLGGDVAEGASAEEITEGMLQKPKGFTASGNRVYLAVTD